MYQDYENSLCDDSGCGDLEQELERELEQEFSPLSPLTPLLQLVPVGSVPQPPQGQVGRSIEHADEFVVETKCI